MEKWLSSAWDSVNGLFSGVSDYSEQADSVAMNAAQTANGVLGNVQNVANAFNSETLTASQQSSAAQKFSDFYAAHSGLVLLGGAVIGGLILFKLLK